MHPDFDRKVFSHLTNPRTTFQLAHINSLLRDLPSYGYEEIGMLQNTLLGRVAAIEHLPFPEIVGLVQTIGAERYKALDSPTRQRIEDYIVAHISTSPGHQLHQVIQVFRHEGLFLDESLVASRLSEHLNKNFQQFSPQQIQDLVQLLDGTPFSIDKQKQKQMEDMMSLQRHYQRQLLKSPSSARIK